MGGKVLNGLIVDDMQAADLPAVIQIEHTSFTAPWSEISFFNELKKPRSIVKVARLDGKVVGYICGGWIIDEGHILDVAVHPQYRELGIASVLTGEVIGLLREEGCRSVFLEVRASNEPAKKMYCKYGFTELGTRKAYYTSPVEDAVIMVLKLTE